MKKIYPQSSLFRFVCCCWLLLGSLSAQAAAGESCTEAIAVTVGSQTVPQQATHQDTWYKFTMPYNGKLSIISPQDIYSQIRTECDGGYLVGYGSGPYAVPELTQGETYYIRFSSYESFTWNLSVGQNEQGDICSLAEEVKEEATYILPEYTTQNYWYKFTMPRDGKLVISNSPTNIWRECGSSLHVPGVVQGAKAGETYYFEFFRKPSQQWSLSIEENEPGDICSLAKPVAQGTHQHSNSATKYIWYKFTMPVNGKLTINKPERLHTTVYSNCNNYLIKYEYNSNTLTANELIAGQTYYIMFQSNGSSFDWSLSAAEQNPGEVCSSAVDVQGGNHRVPENSGSNYWYRFVMPTNGLMEINEPTGTYTYTIYTGCGGATYGGSTGIKKIEDLEAGDDYFIHFQTNGNSFDWSIRSEEIVGNLCTNAVEVQDGTHRVPEHSGNYYWYSYTMPHDGKLVINEASNTYSFLVYDECNGTIVGSGRGSKSIPNLSKDDKLLIRFYSTSQQFDWNIEGKPFEAGDFCTLPAEVEDGAHVASGPNNGEYWYKYTMPTGGTLHLTSTGSMFAVYSECGGAKLSEANAAYLRNLNKGDVFLINFATSGVVNWTINSYGGNNCANALTVAEGDHSHPAQVSTETWYQFTMPQDGKMKITEASNTYGISVYETCGGTSVGYGTGSLTTRGLVGGTAYLIKINNANNAFNWSLATEDFAPGELCSLAVEAIEGSQSMPGNTNQQYWYTYTMPADGRLSITHDYSVPFIVQKECEGDTLYSGTGSRTLEKLEGGVTYLIGFNTYGNFNWTLTTEFYQPGDYCFFPNEISAGDHRLPEQPNYYYWYSFTMPHDGEATIYEPLNHTYYLYDDCDNLEPVQYTGSSTIPSLQAGQNYLIRFSTDNEPFDWQLDFHEYVPGGTCSTAAVASTGINTAPSAHQWYTYTTSDKATLKISSVGHTTIPTHLRLYYVCGGTLIRESIAYNGTEQSYVETPVLPQNTTVFIQWANSFSSEGFDWELIEEIEPLGESCERPALAQEGINTAEAKYFSYYATFTMPEDGNLIIKEPSRQYFFDVYSASSCNGTTIGSGIGIKDFPGLTKGETYTISFRAEGNTFDWELDWITTKSAQTITFDPIESVPFSTRSIQLNITASSGLQPIYYVESGPGRISGDTYTMNGYGPVSIKAFQRGDAYYLPSDTIVRSFCVNPDKPVVKAEGGSYVSDEVTLTSGYYSTAEMQWFRNGSPIEGATGSQHTVVQAGSYSYQVSKDGCSSEMSDPILIQTLQTITFPAIAAHTLAEGSVELMATASSGLSPNYEVVSGNAEINGNIVSFLGAGPVTIKAMQAGNEEYAPAEPVEQSFCINPDKPEITASEGSEISEGISLSSSSQEGNQWFLNGAPIEGANASAYEAGQAGIYTLQVSINGCSSEMADEYIIKDSQSISFAAVEDLPLSSGQLELTGSSSSGLPLVFEVIAGNATVTGSTLQLQEAGSITIKAVQQGNEYFHPAEPVEQSFCVNPDKPGITINGGSQIADGISLSSSSQEGNQWFLNGAPIEGANASVYEVSQTGTYSLQVSGNGCSSEMAEAVILKEFQEISFEPIADVDVSAGSINLSATASSQLPLSFELVSGAAELSGNSLSFQTPGAVTVRAIQAGNETYLAAEPVEQSFCIRPDRPVISVSGEMDSAEGMVLSANSAEGNQWFMNGEPVPNATGQTFSVSQYGRYSLQLTLYGCSSEMAEAVDIKQQQSISFEELGDQLLSTNAVQLNATASSGLEVQFELISGNAEIDGNTLSFLGAGPVTVQAVQDGNSNFTAAEPVAQSFCVNPGKPVIAVSGGTNALEGLVLTSSSQEGNQWFLNGELIEGANGEVLEVSQAGTYSLQVSIDGCSSEMSEPASITGLGDKLPALEVKAYPNPSSGLVWVEFSSAQKAASIKVTLYSINGMALKTQEPQEAGNGLYKVNFDTAELDSGMYYIIIRDGTQIIKARVIKQ